MLVLDGNPGLGKTTTLQRWVAHNQSIYLRAKKTWTPSWFMKELISEFRLDPPHSFERKYALALKELGARQSRAVTAQREFALVIDEADHISNRAEIMETVRDLSDMLELPVVLVGMGKVRDHLTRFPQIASRVSQFIRFEKASEQDVKDLIEGCCEIKIADDLANFVHFASGGMNREVMEAIAHMEAFGRRQKLGDQGLTRTDMAGEMIMNDRQTGEPIIVPEVL